MKAEHKKLFMWHEVTKLFELGLSKLQISEQVNLDRSTVRKYLSMSEAQFYEFLESNTRSMKLSQYFDFVKELLEDASELSASCIEDKIKERHFNDYQVELPKIDSKTFYNFVQMVRQTTGIKKTVASVSRQYSKILETAYGEFAQVDYGEYLMQTLPNEDRKRIHFMVVVLCRSRFKFVYFQDKRFTGETTVAGHILAFEYFGGVPQKMIYDQDSILLVDENLGDYILTATFNQYCVGMNFSRIFCRPGDPESKGKVENVVGFIKKNFLAGRVFTTVDVLNEELLAWLSRTGNGKMHAGIKKIPSQEWLIEKDYLQAIPHSNDVRKSFKSYTVHKDNTISYKSNYYTLPLDTYCKGMSVQVLLEDIDGNINLYNTEGELLTRHKLNLGSGCTVYNTDHKRDKSKSLEALQDKVVVYLSSPKALEYLLLIQDDRPRYFRDSLQVLLRKTKDIEYKHLLTTLDFCLENKIYNANTFTEIALSYQKTAKEDVQVDPSEVKPLPNSVSSRVLKDMENIQTSQLDTYQNLM